MYKPTQYEIRAGKNAPCELISRVPRNFGGDALNFVCEGTHTYCTQIKEELLFKEEERYWKCKQDADESRAEYERECDEN